MGRTRGRGRFGAIAASLVVITSGLVAAVASVPAEAAGTAPTITGLAAAPASLPSSGGSTTLTASVSGATTCAVTAKPTVSGLPGSISCAGGSVSAPVTLPANATTKTEKYTLTLAATGTSTKTAKVKVTVAAPTPVPASITGLLASPESVPASGGTTTLTASLSHASSCTLTAKPAIAGLTKAVACASGSIAEPITLPANTGTQAVSYKLTLTAKGTSKTTASTTVTVSAPTAPVIFNFTDTPVSVGPAGGSVTISAQVTEATTCTLSSTPALSGLPKTVSCSSGTLSVPVTIPANTTTSLVGYAFSLSATGPIGTTTANPISLVQGATSSLPAISVSGTLTQNTTWSPTVASAYTITSSLTIPSGVTLTIAPGTVVKAEGGNTGACGSSAPSLCIGGTLNAVGTASQPIVFTSINDNSVGGATGTGSPKAGDWGGISLDGSGAANLQESHIQYFSQGVSTFSAETSGSLVVSNDTFSDGQWPMYVGDSGSVSVTGNSATGTYAPAFTLIAPTPTVEGNSVSSIVNASSQRPAFEIMGTRLNLSLLGGNSIEPGVGSGFQLAGTLGASGTLLDEPYPWEMTSEDSGINFLNPFLLNYVDVPTGVTLTVAPGTVVKSTGESGISVEGTLNAVGTALQPIVFTSINDNTVGGATVGTRPGVGSRVQRPLRSTWNTPRLNMRTQLSASPVAAANWSRSMPTNSFPTTPRFPSARRLHRTSQSLTIGS